MAYSGGFKIPEEYRKTQKKKLGTHYEVEKEENIEATQQSALTRDEILAHLNLGNSEGGIGVGKHGTNSKAALGKDLVESIEKDLEKLKRTSENIQLRKSVA